MPRARGGFKTRRRRKKVLEMTEGYYGAKSRLFRSATEALDRSLKYAYRDRRNKKREFRALWITRINAAARSAGLTYSQFMSAIKKANISLDRKSIADIAYNDPKAFGQLIETLKQKIAS